MPVPKSNSVIILSTDHTSPCNCHAESRPASIDQLERRVLQLEVEEAALENEESQANSLRLAQVRNELANAKEELVVLEAQYQQEKELLEDIARIQSEIEETKWAIDFNERRYNLDKAAELKYSELPSLKARLSKLLEDKAVGNDTRKPLLTEAVGVEQIAAVVSKWTGIPVTKLTQDEKEKLLHLKDRLHARVVGQDEAVESVSNSIIRSRAGLSRKGKPTASFLFLGPTGVGKTELAKALAQELFDNEKELVRLDMSEYMEQHSVSRLIGAPPGYVGYEQGGQLTEAIRRHPYSVVLLDEVEKAHQRVLNTLLQVLDDGRLTDSKGKVVDFSNVVIIMTSNLGAEYLVSVPNASEQDRDTARKMVMKAVTDHFPPEFINRLDDTVVFQPLQPLEIQKIAKIQLRKLQNRLDQRHITMEFDQSVIDLVALAGYDPIYGARPLTRLIEDVISTEISKLILQSSLEDYSVVKITTLKKQVDIPELSQIQERRSFLKENLIFTAAQSASPVHQPVDVQSAAVVDSDENNEKGKLHDEL